MREEAAFNVAVAGAAVILHFPVVRVLPELLRKGENPLLPLVLLPFVLALLFGFLHKLRPELRGEVS